MASKIQWTEETWNPIRANRSASTDAEYSDKRGMEMLGIDGWHCERVSAGCMNCYAERQNMAAHFGGTGLPYTAPSRKLVEIFLDQKSLAKPLHWRTPRMVFVCSMTDLFGEWVTNEMLDQIFDVMRRTPHITYQVLTKRPYRMRDYANTLERPLEFALPNVWIGTSVEDNNALSRIEVLRTIPAALRWLSVEPLLERILIPSFVNIDWVVVGGESGPRARPFDLAWARSIINQCRGAHVPVFVKQLGAKPVNHQTFLTDTPREFRISLKDAKGGDMLEWPFDLQIREWPAQ